jgi:hypothetical protein
LQRVPVARINDARLAEMAVRAKHFILDASVTAYAACL